MRRFCGNRSRIGTSLKWAQRWCPRNMVDRAFQYTSAGSRMRRFGPTIHRPASAQGLEVRRICGVRGHLC